MLEKARRDPFARSREVDPWLKAAHKTVERSCKTTVWGSDPQEGPIQDLVRRTIVMNVILGKKPPPMSELVRSSRVQGKASGHFASGWTHNLFRGEIP